MSNLRAVQRDDIGVAYKTVIDIC